MYLQQLPILLRFLGLQATQSLSLILGFLTNFCLRQSYSLQLQALKCLEDLVCICAPRIEVHIGKVFETLCQVYIGCSIYLYRNQHGKASSHHNNNSSAQKNRKEILEKSREEPEKAILQEVVVIGRLLYSISTDKVSNEQLACWFWGSSLCFVFLFWFGLFLFLFLFPFWRHWLLLINYSWYRKYDLVTIHFLWYNQNTDERIWRRIQNNARVAAIYPRYSKSKPFVIFSVDF